MPSFWAGQGRARRLRARMRGVDAQPAEAEDDERFVEPLSGAFRRELEDRVVLHALVHDAPHREGSRHIESVSI